MFINGLTGAVMMIVALIFWWYKILSHPTFIFIMCVLIIMMFVGVGAIYNAYEPGDPPIYVSIISSYWPIVVSSIISLIVVPIRFKKDEENKK